MNTTRQEITLSRGGKAFIQTPLGRISITKTGSKLDFVLPPLMTAYKKGNQHTAGEVPVFVEQDKGSVKPTFDILSAVIDEDGELVDLRVPEPIRIRGEELCSSPT
jgi:hypothetical protein